MAAAPVPALFSAVDTAVVIISRDDTLLPGKIIKVTKTQVTVEYRQRGLTQTERFVPSRWNDRNKTEMEQYGMRDAWNSPSRLLLATDPSLPGRRKAAAKRRTELVLKAVTSKLSGKTSPTEKDLDAIVAAVEAYRATLTPAADAE